jgi:hypothetical protein
MVNMVNRAVCLVALASCSVEAPDLLVKSCPCVDGFTCKLELKQCFRAEIGAVDRLGCVIYSDGKLYCNNRSGTEMYAQPAASGPVINHLETTYSWFICWRTGEPHAGGNTTWYFTDGDDHAAPYGWLPAIDVHAPQAFSADPAAYGFPECPSR